MKKSLVNKIIKELKIQRACCFEALDGTWDRSDAGFQSMIDGLDALLVKIEQYQKDNK